MEKGSLHGVLAHGGSSRLSLQERAALHVVASDAVHTLATWRNVALQFWWAQPTMAALRLSRETMRALLATLGGPAGMFGFIRADVPLLAAPERAYAEQMMKDFGSQVRCCASVIEGEGFTAGALRSVMTALLMVTRQSCPTKMFGTIDPAAQWQASQLPAHEGRAVSSLALATVARELHAARPAA